MNSENYDVLIIIFYLVCLAALAYSNLPNSPSGAAFIILLAGLVSYFGISLKLDKTIEEIKNLKGKENKEIKNGK